MLIDGMCREGKIPDLSQADTSYYQVHKIQPITKHHVLLLFGLIKAFHMGGSTLRKLSHPAESSTTFNYFTRRVKCKNPFLKLIPTPHSEIVCVNESRGGICRGGKFPTYLKLTHHTTKSTKYDQLQSSMYCC